MARSSGRFGFSRVIWDDEVVGSADEDDTARVASSASEDAAMDVDSRYSPSLELNSRSSSHTSPTPSPPEVQSEIEKAREIIGGIKLCKISVEPLDKGQVCYQGSSRFRILKTNWRREAELRRIAVAFEPGVTHSDATLESSQSGRDFPMFSPPDIPHPPKEPSLMNKNTESSSAPTMNAARQRAHKTNTNLFHRRKLASTLRTNNKWVKAQSHLDNGKLPAAKLTTLNCQEGLECPLEGCGTRFTRQGDHHRHMRTVHQRAEVMCRECGSSFSRNDSLKRHVTRVHRGTSSMHGGNSKSASKCA
ncbi:hypothetical protein M413DRAFT_445208 [Hebeloma cylindrosporum]|uniref:C2H2-type domain-containing protein n=1 Tax=Hebeloma cylindrosporum TaxID=76867 RepID=A0A0C3BZK3_HEBCY|nr:hypothetical protein M413DRAFT_445208 [Hebeloma cylindrosporum h7]